MNTIVKFKQKQNIISFILEFNSVPTPVGEWWMESLRVLFSWQDYKLL